jgi:predicted DNA binding CopG/RHH family protein
MKRKIPKFTNDEQAEAFLNQDLSDLDFSQFKPTRFRVSEEDCSNQSAYSESAIRGSEEAFDGTWHPLYPFYSRSP